MLLALVALSAWVVCAEETAQQPVFHVGTDLVQLDVSVLDGNNLPVRGLTAADFIVRADDVVQHITTFAAIDLADRVRTAAPWTYEVAPDVATNRIEAQRVVIILLDDFFSPRQPDVLKLARDTAYVTIDQLGASDLAAVVYMVNRRHGQELTTDRALLRTAIDRFVPSGFVDSLGAPRNSAAYSNGGYRPPSINQSGACLQLACMSMALQNIADVLREWPGARKTVVFVSPGPNQGVGSVEELAGFETLKQALKGMQAANVNVYAFDPRGLRTEVSVSDRKAWGDFAAYVASTGGRALTDSNAPASYVPQVFRENSSYYLLGFEPTDTRQNGRMRRLNVSVNRPGLEVRTRTGFYPPEPARKPNPSKRPPPTALERAIAGGLPGGDLPVSVAVAPFRGSGSSPGVIVIQTTLDVVDANAGDLEIVASAFTDRWQSAGTVTQRAQVRGGRNANATPVDVVSRLALKPGRYQLRVAATQQATGRTGVAHASVTVPDFAKAPVSLSGVVLLDEGRPQVATPRILADLLTVDPTTRRQFSPTDRVTALLRVYQGGTKPLTSVEVRTTIADAMGGFAYRETHTVAPSQFGAIRSSDQSLRLPLSTLPVGEYLLSFEVVGVNDPLRRDLRFSLR